MFVMDFPQLMPPTLISRDLDEINAFRDEHGAVVMKPLHGHGGAAVFRVMPQDMNFGSLFDMFSVTFREPWVIQRFLPEVKHGDKRIILVDGEFAGAVNRVPAADDLRSNMVRGGAAQATDLTPREREICATLGPALRERGLLFVGIDVIDGFLTEINVTSPDRHPRHRAARRAGCRGEDLGRDREEAGRLAPLQRDMRYPAAIDSPARHGGDSVGASRPGPTPVGPRRFSTKAAPRPRGRLRPRPAYGIAMAPSRRLRRNHTDRRIAASTTLDAVLRSLIAKTATPVRSFADVLMPLLAAGRCTASRIP